MDRSELFVWLSVFVAVRVASVFQLPVTDCDETMNFVEPQHFLLYGYGMQTWEYSKQYALRSYAYLWIYTAPAVAVRYVVRTLGVDACSAVVAHLLPPQLPSPTTLSLTEPVLVYFGSRCVTAVAAVLGEVAFVQSLPFLLPSTRSSQQRATTLQRLALVALIASVSVGHAAFSTLPTSTCMTLFFVALSAWIRVVHAHATRSCVRARDVCLGVLCVVAVGILGWPFALLLALPMALQYAYVSFVKSSIAAVLSVAVVGGVTGVVDGTYYCEVMTSAALAIVRYNVFGADGRGAHLYGTEPWSYFVKNLLIQFNVLFVVVVAVLPVLVLRAAVGRLRCSTTSFSSVRGEALHAAWFSLPFFMWFGMWLCVPHKEERFMVPAYPFLVLAAVCTLYVVWYSGDAPVTTKGHSEPRRCMWRRRVVLVLLCLFVVLSFGRFSALRQYYLGPQAMWVHAASSLTSVQSKPAVVCVGKEWYRFPTHFFLPRSAPADAVQFTTYRFLQTPSFQGALPLPFAAEGSCAARTDLNDLNRPNAGQWVTNSTEECDYVWDSLPSAELLSEQTQQGYEEVVSHLGWDPRIFAVNGLPDAPEGTFKLLDVSRTPTWCRVLNFPSLLNVAFAGQGSSSVYDRCAQWSVLVLRRKLLDGQS